PMPFLAACTSCGRESHVPDRALGTTMRCPGCSTVFVLTAKNPSRPTAGAAPPAHPPGRSPFLAGRPFCGPQSHRPARAQGARWGEGVVVSAVFELLHGRGRQAPKRRRGAGAGGSAAAFARGKRRTRCDSLVDRSARAAAGGLRLGGTRPSR